MKYPSGWTRRAFLASVASVVTIAPRVSRAGSARADNGIQVRLKPAPARVRLVPEPYAETDVWAFNQTVPGPEIRVRQGDTVRILVENGLHEDTTLHWHGVRLPNGMDGVPHLTQPPIRPGERFVYEFDAVDAGTFWYHPHMPSGEQVGRGLYGPLVIEEAEPPRVDRDIVWVLDDWRLSREAVVSPDFENGHDMSHDGRLGNTVTINGKVPDRFAVRRGERLRLRVINAANARIFALRFDQHQPVVIAWDGQPVTPHVPDAGEVLLGPGMRADLMLDCGGDSGQRYPVTDHFYAGQEYRLVDLEYQANGLRDRTPEWSFALAPNPLPLPDPATAVRHEVRFDGGMMAGMVMQRMGLEPIPHLAGRMREMAEAGKFWFVNGVAAESHRSEPMLTVARGDSCVIEMTNVTAFFHPMHLHGHSFRVLARDGRPTRYGEWVDTVLVAPRERVGIAFVADNPGDWMFHCHILEHMVAGMMGVVRVT